MRIRRIRIGTWRHFRNLEITLADDAALVCVVGANGTGKSHLLELIAACAHQIGLAHGVELPRGDPFGDNHEIEFQIYLAPGISQAIDTGLAGNPNFAHWDRVLHLRSQRSPTGASVVLQAGGIADAGQASNFAGQILTALRQSKDVHFVSLDADRAYPKKNLHINEIAQAYEIDWGAEEYTRGRSFRASSTLYDEWIKYFLAQENQAGTKLIQGIRRAREAQAAEPAFTDHFGSYKSSVAKVLPHLSFVGVDSKARTLLFDTTGMQLTFHQLSGGEREIAFLIGQIERFQLRHGLFLLDEPELHLNADLIRTWVAYLTGTVQTGQIWLATHSLEAVEAAGQRSTFVLERNLTTRRVDSVARLDSRPVLSALSRAVGSPAFSLSSLRFVFVEGEDGVGERERYRRIAGVPADTRFMECGSCTEVVRRVETIKALSAEQQAELRIGGIVDRDWQTDADAKGLNEQHGIFVLAVHEVENLFLDPRTIAALIAQNGARCPPHTDLIQAASDARAGSWIFQYAMATRNARALPEIAVSAKERAKGKAWAEFEADEQGVIASVCQVSGLQEADAETLADILRVAVGAYRRRRAQADLWKYCEGKQVLSSIAAQLGFGGMTALVQAALTAWERDAGLLPAEVVAVRAYLGTL